MLGKPSRFFYLKRYQIPFLQSVKGYSHPNFVLIEKIIGIFKPFEIISGNDIVIYKPIIIYTAAPSGKLGL
jgi:hypothetical protein